MISLNGWQSWSNCGKVLFKGIPANRFSPFGKDNDSAAVLNQPGVKLPVNGWCSWSAFGININEEIILSHAKWIANHKKEVPLDYVLIDDGWAHWGDWLSPERKKFPQELKFISGKIKNLGLKPGLWIAPFLVHPKSVLAKEHPEYLIKDKKGNLVNGLIFHRFFSSRKRWILDIRKQEARTYIERVLRVIIKEWGFELLKLDYLYAQHFNPIFENQETPDRLLSDFLEKIKNDYPEIFTIASGCPLKPAISKVDAKRISDDIILPFMKNIFIINRFVHLCRLRQLENNLQKRYQTRLFWNLDPDIFVCGKPFGFNKMQIKRLSDLIKSAGGLKFLGDNLPSLSKERVKLFIVPLFKD